MQAEFSEMHPQIILCSCSCFFPPNTGSRFLPYPSHLVMSSHHFSFPNSFSFLIFMQLHSSVSRALFVFVIFVFPFIPLLVLLALPFASCFFKFFLLLTLPSFFLLFLLSPESFCTMWSKERRPVPGIERGSPSL